MRRADRANEIHRASACLTPANVLNNIIYENGFERKDETRRMCGAWRGPRPAEDDGMPQVVDRWTYL